jgi:hypothetical protein
LAAALAGGLAAALAAGLGAMLAAGLVGCITSFSPRPSSATGSRGLLLRRRWRGRSDLLLGRNLMPIYCIQGLFLQSERR